MFTFNELSKEAQNLSIQGFIESARPILGDTVEESLVKGFLSESKVHRFDQKGSILGKMVNLKGDKTFEPHGRY
ncbi:hypothetical protein QNH48_28365 [Neobacillus sp. YX16]|uniref:hypothetical protein n=1 Tax=Neobacillus sp. YX16 TaxID=3047874 RepID=UPI0024C41B63|nr:hypothetical protein [Neobacillus sp. YX16]WHZ02788.1 hypothetical protein QNH48_28365 [Neobacillus sp. YX16]